MSHYKAYPKYKDSGVDWIGEVPEHWTVMQFKRAASICNGQDYKDIEDADGAYPVIGSGGEFARASSFIYNGESVLLGRKGTIDKPLYINGPFWTVDTMFYTKIAVDAFPKFVYYSALNIPFDLYSTNTALPSMTGEALSSHLIAAPKLTEQRDIANKLDRETARIDAIIAKKTRFIELLKEKRSALITHAVTKGLNPNVKMKDSGVDWIGEVPEHWELRKVAWDMKMTIGWTPPTGNRSYYGGPHNWVSISDLSAGRISETKQTLTDAAISEMHGSQAPAGSLLFSYKLSIGEVALLETPAYTNEAIAAFHPCKRVYMPFWRYAAPIILPHYSRKNIYGSDLLNQELMNSARMVIPDFNEQIAISQWIDRETARIDLLTQKTQHSIDLLKERRAALITAAVTGQIDLREDT